MSPPTPSSYTIYLLRLWIESEADAVWRFSLEEPRTGARRGFATLDELVHFLQQETTKETRKR